MAHHFDSYDNSLVIDGFEQGIADNPYNGIADMRNANVISIPGEASVNFKTQRISTPTVPSGTVVSADPSTDDIVFTGALSPDIEARMAVIFAGGSLPTGITAGTIYWVSNVSLGGGIKTFRIYTEPALDNLVNITATGTGTFTVVNSAGAPIKHFTYDSLNQSTWGVDSNGRVWTNALVTPSGYWVYTGNLPNNFSNGNGIVFMQASSSGGSSPVGYIFVFHNGSIDYTLSANGVIAWNYQWSPAAGSIGVWSATPTRVLKTLSGQNYSHEALFAPDSRVYFCDSNWIGRWYQTDPNVAFVPTTLATYTFDQTALLPTTDLAQCLAYLGTNILVGGQRNIIYPWNRFSPNFEYPILLAEYNTQKMVTINTNTYIFVGNRGRIYVTSGSSVSLYKKVPDHISGTVEPYFTWGGTCSVKNQLYFSTKATDNSGTAIAQYGGVWAIDVDTKAIRLTNKLSYDNYSGYATALIPNFATTPAGAGLFIGWDSSSTTTPAYGIDTTIATPYSNNEVTIDSDLIPVGTYQKPRDLTTVEYRLSRPLVSGESIIIKTRLIFNTSDTGYTTTLTDSTVGNYSSYASINFRNAQWVQFQVVLNSTASTPSYVRLKEIRVLGLVKSVR